MPVVPVPPVPPVPPVRPVPPVPPVRPVRRNAPFVRMNFACSRDAARARATAQT
ncbi:hypothetical protein [Streptomyces sp. NPDC047108]|uniref:hypothetical protein n=1 Tax=Streptomyces sp. NPDC047108 TaxID=3155025 RepID=UPI0033E0F495